ncbi:serine hydrolase domain-containing protein [Embleya sp. NPDC056575]|uniref:serine hydrolase domain-containing protein n=1 Tax=unclassified Embleya TaxID=2699296 RepID=UPI00367D7723
MSEVGEVGEREAAVAMRTVRKGLVAALAVVATIAVGAGVPSTASDTAAATGVSAAAGAGHEQTRAAMDFAIRSGVPGVIVRARDAHGTWRATAGVADLRTGRPPRPVDRFRVGSISKPFIAAVLLQLEAEGRLSLADSVEKWLPGLVRGNGNDGRAITLRQLLNHTGGVADYTDDPDLHLLGKTFLDHRYDTWTPERLVAIGLKHAPTFPPGAGWNYTTTAYVLAAMVVERVTGHTYAAEVDRRVFVPLGLRSTLLPGTYPRIPAPSGRMYTRFPDDPDQTVYDITEFDPSWGWAAGELVSDTTDLDGFLTALMRGRLLPEAQMAELTTTVPSPDFGDGQDDGLGVFRATLPCGTQVWGHTGFLPGSQSMAYTTRDGGHTLVVNFDTDWAGDTDAAGYLLLAEFCGTAPPSALTSPPPTPRGPRSRPR